MKQPNPPSDFSFPMKILFWFILIPVYAVAIPFLIFLTLMVTLSQSPKRSIRMYKDMWRDRHKRLGDFTKPLFEFRFDDKEEG